MTIYDPPSGWMCGFPREYKPLEGESLAATLRRDGYPEKFDPDGAAKHCRFWEETPGNSREEYKKTLEYAWTNNYLAMYNAMEEDGYSPDVNWRTLRETNTKVEAPISIESRIERTE